MTANHDKEARKKLHCYREITNKKGIKNAYDYA